MAGSAPNSESKTGEAGNPSRKWRSLARVMGTLLCAIGFLTVAREITAWAKREFGPPGAHRELMADFGSPAAITDLNELYSRIEAAGHDPGLPVVDRAWPPEPEYPRIRNLPKAWLPERFQAKWGTRDAARATGWWCVLGYYDQADKLIAIEFLGPRYGCFASREPERCPTEYGSLARLTQTPLWITGRVADR